MMYSTIAIIGFLAIAACFVTADESKRAGDDTRVVVVEVPEQDSSKTPLVREKRFIGLGLLAGGALAGGALAGGALAGGALLAKGAFIG